MLRSIRNIFFTVAISLLVFWLWIAFTENDFSIEFSDLLVLVTVTFLLTTMLTLLLWALGLTRFSTVHVRQRAAIVLNYLEQAVRMNLPLSGMLIAAEASEPRWTARPIRQVRKQLDNGSSIADALRKSVPGISARTVALVGAAEHVGQLGPELTRLVQDAQNRQNQNLGERTFIRSYPVAMTMIIVAILSMVMVFVMPKFAQIFHDFHAELPPLTRVVINFSDLFDGPGWMFLAIGLTLVFAVVQKIRHRWKWLSPQRWFTSSRDLGDICHVIAEGVAANLPLDTAILNASNLAIGRRLCRKLQQWAVGIQSGVTASDAANAADLPSLIARLTTTAQGFEFLSRYYAGKHSRLMILIRAATIPMMVFFFGIIVAMLALALFLPLIALIDSVSPGSNPYSRWL